MNYRIALIQMHVEGGERTQNLTHAIKMIREAAANGAKLAVLPEIMDWGWTHPAGRRGAEPLPDGEPCQQLRQVAAETGIHVCAGLTEQADTAIYNTAVLIDSRGQVIGTHRKVNELDIGHDLYDQGTRLQVVHTELGAIGLMVCADGFAKDCVLSRALGYMGADIILSPSAWAVPVDHDEIRAPYGKVWRDAYLPVAKEFSLWIVGVSNVGRITAGPWAGRNCIGCSMVASPDGTEVLRGPFGREAMLFADIEIRKRPARGNNWIEYWKKRSGAAGP